MDKNDHIIDISPRTLVKLANWLNICDSLPITYAETEICHGFITKPIMLLEIYIQIEGEMHYLVGNRKALAKPGDIILANAKYGNQGISKSEKVCHGCISFAIAKIPEFEAWNKTPVLQISHIKNFQAIRESFRKICSGHIIKNDHMEPLRHKANTLNLLIELYESIIANSTGKVDLSQDDRLELAIRLLQERAGDANFSINKLAKKMNMSPDYVGRLLKRGIGIGPKQYLLQYRVNRAKGLLQRTSLSVKEIAHVTGFNDPLYFSRAFHKIAKISPRKFREECSKNEQ